MTGEIRVGDVAVPMTQASGYVDHSWGRWHWGEDIGWEWGSFLTCAPGPALVLSRVTDRLHTRASGTAIELRLGARRRAFHEHTVEVSWSGQLVADPRRLPGSLAVLHADRARPRLPATLRLRADDGRDSVQLEFTGRAVAQLILADTTERGYSFLHEIVGSFTCSGRIGGVTFADDGLAVVERVE
jgi:hypothetical protein